MNYTEKLSQWQHYLTKKESKQIAEKLSKTYWLMADMCEPQFPMPSISDEDAWTQEWEVRDHLWRTLTRKAHLYSMLGFAVDRILTCDRRSNKMIMDLRKAMEDAEEKGLNVY